MLSELPENEVLSVAFYGEETDWNSGCVFSDAYETHTDTYTHPRSDYAMNYNLFADEIALKLLLSASLAFVNVLHLWLRVCENVFV